jgi:putative flippase GtrA
VTPIEAAKRIGRGTLKSENWVQLFQFGLVGGSGYLVNLSVFALLNQLVSVHYIPAAIGAFCVAVTNNFLWNRHWTFRATHGHAGFQAARFLVVSLFALAFNLAMLELLVSVADVGKIPAQALAVLAATPLNFVGNKLWSFGTPATPTRGTAAG